jgi:cobalt/nickel transport system ATP-binding protein
MDSLMPIIHKSTINIDFPPFEGDVVAIDDLHFAYPDGQIALRGINLKIGAGEKVALVGPNGAGKSTLLLHLNGILGENGSVSIAGILMNKRDLPIIRAIVGLVFQDPDDQLFSPTVFEDVAFGPLHMGLPEDEVIARVENALDAVQMNDYSHRFSHHLSMGQKKRIAIASVLAMHPQILVLDEPSLGLDPRSRRTLINLLRELPLTMLVATHDLRLVQELLPRMVIMDEGAIVADGLTSKLLDDESLLVSHGLEKPYTWTS